MTDNKNATDVQGLVANRERKESSIKKLSYDGDNWAGIYDPETKVMLGGVWFGRESYDNDFKITEVEEENVQDALKYCAGLFVEYGTITLPFNELQKTYEETSRRNAEQYTFENWVFEEIKH